MPKRATLTKRRFVGFVVCWRNKIFVRRRPSFGVNAGFWEFPNWEVNAATKATQVAKKKTIFWPSGFGPALCC